MPARPASRPHDREMRARSLVGCRLTLVELLREKFQCAPGSIFCGARIGRVALVLGTWIVEVVGRARIDRYVDPAALRVAARDQIGAALWRNFLVGAAVHHLDRRIRPVAGIETALERTRRIERESGPKPH